MRMLEGQGDMSARCHYFSHCHGDSGVTCSFYRLVGQHRGRRLQGPDWEVTKLKPQMQCSAWLAPRSENIE